MIPTPEGLTLDLAALTPHLRDELLAGWERGEPGHRRAGDRLELPHAALWALGDEVLGALGIHRYAKRLLVHEQGLLKAPSYRWRLDWAGQDATVQGGWLVDWRGARSLLPPALRAAARLAAVVAEAAQAGQRGRVLRAIAQLQGLARDCPALVPPDRLRRVAVLEATAVRAEVEGSPEAPTVRPVVLVRPPAPVMDDEGGEGAPRPAVGEVGPTARQAPAPAAAEGEAPGEAEPDAEPWGAPAAREDLGQPLERDPAALLLGVGQAVVDVVWSQGDTHVLLPAAVSRNLALTLAAQQASPADRAAFIDNPLAFLPDAAAFDEAHYSARVIGLREAPKASGRAPLEPRTWATPLDGLLIELPDGPLWVPGEDLPGLAEALRAAAAAGEARVMVGARSLPVRPDVIDAVERAARPPGSAVDAPGEGRRPLILAIRENELEIEWAPDAALRRPRDVEGPPLRAGLQLKPHQQVALRRLRALWLRGEPGALLCDDMGLGKTLQGACFAAWVCAQLAAGGGPALRATGRLPLMLVAPPSLLRTWFDELEARLDPRALSTIVWAGDSPPRSASGRRVLSLGHLRADLKRSAAGSVVLEHARLDLEAWDAARPDALFIGYDSLRTLQHALGALDVGLLVADEAQAVKNPGSLRAHALRAMHYDFALALTGTPIENAWLDLWAICDVALPGRLGTAKDFQRDFPQRGDVQAVGALLQERLSAHLIRRTRAATLGDTLPPCTISADRREMPAPQALAYRAELARAGAAQGAAVLPLLQGLALVSLHPRPRAELHTAEEARDWMRGSARTAAALDALDRWAEEGQPALVFVRSLALQETLSRALSLIYTLPPVPVLNGQLSFAARQAAVAGVRAGRGFRVLLVSPEVGGAGWNLQFAARSVLLERPFNPAVEAQMVARTWRLGQTAAVEVVAPVALMPGHTSFDEVLDGLLEEKRQLADSVLAPCQVSEQELSQRFASVLG
ncbi:MAG: hypothetical protein RL071_3431 [Pseudomonadota bacterium]